MEEFILHGRERTGGNGLKLLQESFRGSPSLEVFKNHVDVALRDVVSGHGGVGWMISMVFSNLTDYMILRSAMAMLTETQNNLAKLCHLS